MRTINGGIHYFATNHGRLTPLSARSFWFLIVLQPVALSTVLLHLLLENRWRYKLEKKFLDTMDAHNR